MNCEHCGANIDKASNFCPVCGNKVEKKEPSLNHGEEEKKTDSFFNKLINKKTNIDKKEEQKDTSQEYKNLEDLDDKNKDPNKDRDELGNKTKQASSDEEDVLNEESDLKEDDKSGNESSETIDSNDESFDDEIDPYDRTNKENRRYINLGNKESPCNQRSIIEEVQAKVSLNQKKKKN